MLSTTCEARENTFLLNMTILDFLASINGAGCLFAGNNQFLGVLSTDQYNQNSISNPHGQYGSPHGLYSIRNLHGLYGGQHGLYSPYNPYCTNPPVIGYQGQAVVMITRNNYAFTNGLPVIDPDFLLSVYVQSQNASNIYQSQNTSNSYLLQAMQSAYNLFK